VTHPSPFSVGILGGTGYTGLELLRLLLPHPGFDVAVVTGRQQAGSPVEAHWPQLSGALNLRFSPPDVDLLAACQLVFCATPHAAAMAIVPELLARGVRVVDLSADFRLRDLDAWERWYGVVHTARETQAEAVYGLPELNAQAIPGARLVANPGCYPTATALPLLPLAEAGLLDGRRIIVDAKSGVSGAGRKASEALLFGAVAETFKPYALGGHRHLPEITQVLEDAGAKTPSVVFVPHLVPMFRGMQVTTYIDGLPESADALRRRAAARFAGAPFVSCLAGETVPDTGSVRASNQCRVNYFDAPEGTTVVVSVIDNLNKGAAGQAVQNANLMCGFAENLGLDLIPVGP